jgi:uncharacterized membrane protein
MWNITSFTDMKSFMDMPNSFTGGWFWTMMLVAIGAVIFVISSQKVSSDRAFGITGFGLWIFGSFMYYLGWINWMVYLGTIFIMIAGIISMIVRQEQEN